MPRRTGYKRRRANATGISKSRSAKYARYRKDQMVLVPPTNMRISGYVGRELKFIDCARGSVAMSATWAAIAPSTGVTNCLSCPAQGDTESSRDGRHYYIHSIYMRGLITKAATEAQAAPIPEITCRICLIIDTQTNAAVVTASDVMDTGATNVISAFRNLQNAKRFRVLWDKVFRIKPETTNEGAVNSFASSAVSLPWKYYKQFKKPIPVNCVGTTADVASVSDNSIQLIGVTTDATAAIQYECRVRFTG